MDTIDTSGYSNDLKYLNSITRDIILRTEAKFGCVIRIFATNNDAKMTKMRKDLQECFDDDVNHDDIIMYGCGRIF